MKISFTQEEMVEGQPIEGFFEAEVSDAVSQPSKDSQSINHIAFLRLTHKADGTPLDVPREIKHYFNSQAKFTMKPFLAALAGISLAEFIEKHKSGIDFEFEQTKGGKCQVQVGPEPGKDGKIYQNKVKAFYPSGYKVPF